MLTSAAAGSQSWWRPKIGGWNFSKQLRLCFGSIVL